MLDTGLSEASFLQESSANAKDRARSLSQLSMPFDPSGWENLATVAQGTHQVDAQKGTITPCYYLQYHQTIISFSSNIFYY